MKDDNLFAGMNEPELYEDEFEDDVEDVIDKLLDPDNTDPITLYNDEGQPVTFEQVAIIPHLERLFVVLKPMDNIDGVADDEALALELIENDEGILLEVVVDEVLVNAVFAKYYDLAKKSN